MDDDIMIAANNNGDIMTFDRKTGKGINSFNRHGRGPGEYPDPYIMSIAVDRSRNEMYVTLGVHYGGTDYLIYIYSLEGKPLRTLKLNNFMFPNFFHSYDEGHLFYRDPDYDTSSPEPYGLVSKTDTLVTRLPVRMEGRRTMQITIETAQGSRISRSGGYPIAHTREGYMFSEPGIDTMFRWNRATETLTPVMTRIPSFASMNYPIGLFYLAENDDYMFLQTVERKWDGPESSEGFKTVNLLYDKQDGGFYETTIVNGDFADERTSSFEPDPGVPAGVFVVALQPYELLDLHEQGKLRGRLAEVAPTLKEDDNPVIMIVTLK
jgi:hypothetical protein